jgi:hypothetical protein
MFHIGTVCSCSEKAKENHLSETPKAEACIIVVHLLLSLTLTLHLSVIQTSGASTTSESTVSLLQSLITLHHYTFVTLLSLFPLNCIIKQYWTTLKIIHLLQHERTLAFISLFLSQTIKDNESFQLSKYYYYITISCFFLTKLHYY